MATEDNRDLPQQRVRPGRVTKGHAQWKQGVGRDRTDPRYHSTTARGGPITRRNINDVQLIETSIVRLCCPDTKPGGVCQHGVGRIEMSDRGVGIAYNEKNESP
jgi:hypothetical protein